MCGIFGLVIPENSNLKKESLIKFINKIFRVSESRGKEASGLAIRSHEINIYKQSMPASKMLQTLEYKKFINKILDQACNAQGYLKHPLALIGHSRLVTNGSQGLQDNNQPINYNGLVAVHNGIVVNDEEIWRSHSHLNRETNLDSEALVALLGDELQNDPNFFTAMSKVYEKMVGSASIATLFDQIPSLFLTTNTGSLYIQEINQPHIICFASEEYIIKQALYSKEAKKMNISPTAVKSTSKQLTPLHAATIDLKTNTINIQPCEKSTNETHFSSLTTHSKIRIQDLSLQHKQLRDSLQRCSKCILPETMPFIYFDENGICNYCNNYQSITIKTKEELIHDAQSYIQTHQNNNANCLVAFSGGRDSSYGLYYIKEILGLKPIAYTFDWGMVTNIARRNQARICGKLGIEHIVISADIRKKRDNIRKNVEAWLKKPSLGMIPLFMAGDKQYMYYPFKIMENIGLNMLFFCGNRLEKTSFKTGFCGVEDVSNWYFDFSIQKKTQILSYYAKQYMTNWSYFNSSLLDTFAGVYSSFFRKSNYLQLFDYINWDENEINSTLKNEFDWEFAGDSESSWRIGDGTSAFYNYIYYTVAGFTENDTFRSNQIREGMITREEALQSVMRENQPRYETIKDYATTIGFDYDHALQVINSIPKLYVKNENLETT